MPRNIRLSRYEEYDISGDPDVLTRTVWYLYYKTGNVSNIIVKDEYAGSGTAGDYDWYRSLAFYYTTSGQVWQILWDRWKLDGGGDIVDYDTLTAREFRYDTPRARYLSRPVDPDTFAAGGLSTWEWTCYDGDDPYGDFGVALNGSSIPIATDVMRYFGGSTVQQIVSNSDIHYNHGDLIGSTIATSDTIGDALGTTAYTAFGVPCGGSLASAARSGFAGRWGYESGLTTSPTLIPSLMHVGARWYDANVGRFYQSDPIGILGGINTYAYARAQPVTNVDPDGESIFGVDSPIFGRGGARGRGAGMRPGILNRGNLRLGWSWHNGFKQNLFSLHGGQPRTPGHWHLYPNRFIPSGPGPAPVWARVCVWAARGTAIGGAAVGGWVVGRGIDNGVESIFGRSLSDVIGDGLGNACSTCWDWVWW